MMMICSLPNCCFSGANFQPNSIVRLNFTSDYEIHGLLRGCSRFRYLLSRLLFSFRSRGIVLIDAVFIAAVAAIVEVPFIVCLCEDVIEPVLFCLMVVLL